jgi:hypothetical protein
MAGPFKKRSDFSFYDYSVILIANSRFQFVFTPKIYTYFRNTLLIFKGEMTYTVINHTKGWGHAS